MAQTLKRTTITRYLGVILAILVIIDTIPTVAYNRPPDRNSLNTALAQALAENLVVSNDYRVSLQGRSLTRIFPFYFPSFYQAGGRTLGLDLNPYYQSWYDTEVFFKDDLSTLNNVYIEDQPTFDVTNLIGAPENFASPAYWLNWYGVDTARISYLESQGVRINVVSPTLLQQLQTQGPAGTNSLINLLSPTIPLQTQNLTLASTVPSQTVTLTSGQWTAGYSQNANAQLQSYPNNLTLTINIPDITKPAQLVLDAALPNSLVLSDQLITQVQIESNVNSSF